MLNNFETTIAELNQEQHISRSIEFTVQEDFMKNLPSIVSNLAEVKAWAEEQTKADRNLLLVSEEDFENAKERSAALNKQIKLIEDKRKEVKKEYNRPYEIFEKAAKEVVSVLTTARENLWGQVKKAEEEQQEQKKQLLKEEWEKLNSGTIGGYRTFAQVFNPKWLNKGAKIESVFDEMKALFEASVSDVTAIRCLNSEFEVSLLEYYKDGHNVSEVITYNNRLNEQKRLKFQQEEQSRINTQPKAENANLTAKNERGGELEEKIRMEFYVECTNEQLSDLGRYMRENGIKYGRIKN